MAVLAPHMGRARAGAALGHPTHDVDVWPEAKFARAVLLPRSKRGQETNEIIYLIGLVVVVMFVLSLLGLR